MVPLTKKEILPTFFLSVSNRQTDNIRSPLEMLFRRAKPIPVPMTTPPNRGIHDRIVGQRNHWHELNKEGTHRNRNKGKDGKFMANLIPSHNHQRDIDGIKGQGKRGIVKPIKRWFRTDKI